MSGMMLHGLGDCTPSQNCGCIDPPAADALEATRARLCVARDVLRGMAGESREAIERSRLHGKVEGVALAISYLDEAAHDQA